MRPVRHWSASYGCRRRAEDIHQWVEFRRPRETGHRSSVLEFLLTHTAPAASLLPLRSEPLLSSRSLGSARSQIRTYAQPAGSTPDANADSTAALRDAIVAELDTLNDRLLSLPSEQSSTPGWLLPLTRAETDFVNMGQVPCPDGCEMLALLDLSTGPGAIKNAGVGPEGKGVHVPLLALVGSTEPAVPCYPVENLFGDTAPSVMGKVRGLVAAQRKAQQGEGGSVAQGMEDIRRDAGDASLVALLVPGDGKRDLGLPLALALFRLAMAEGNGYTGDK